MSDRGGRGGKRWGRGGGSPATVHVPPGQGGEQQKPKKAKDDSGKKSDKVKAEHEPLDRLQFLTVNLLGHRVQVRLKDATVYEGIFGGATADGGYIIKFARKSEDRSKLVYPPAESLTVSAADFVELVAREVDFALSAHAPERHRPSGFRTDTEISGGYDGGERELQRWTPDDDDSALSSLDTFSTSGSRGWDQFSVNEKLYGYQSTYREEIYTTELDKSSVAYRSRIEQASRIADEIERGTSRNIHMQEERGHIPTGGDEVDEEDRYGAVIRHPEPAKEGKYVPPSKRGGGAAGGEAAKPEASAPIAIGDSKGERVTPPGSPLGGSPGSPKLHRRESDPKLNPLLAESMRVRQTLVKASAKTATSAEAKGKGSPLQSPLVGDPQAIQSLALEVVPPKVSEEVHKKFEEYQARTRPGKDETIADLKKAKETLENSSPRLRSLSSSGGNPTAGATSPAASPAAPSTPSSSAAAGATSPAPPSPASAKPASKLNPNAKVFTPLSAKAAVFVPKNMPPSSPSAPAAAPAPAASPQHQPAHHGGGPRHEPQLADIYNESAAQRLKHAHNMNDAPGAEQVAPSWPHGRPASYKAMTADDEQRILAKQEQHAMYGRMPIPAYIPPQALPPNAAPQMIYVPTGYGRAPPAYAFVPGPMSPPAAIIPKGGPRSPAAPASPKGATPGSPPAYAVSPPQNVMIMGGYQQPVLVRPYAMPLDDLKSAKGGRTVPFDPSQMDPAFQQQYMARHAAMHGGAGFPGAFVAPGGDGQAPEVVHGFAVPNTDALPTQP